MNEPDHVTETMDATDKQGSWGSRHPKLSILLIAAVFYAILFSMCGFVLVLLLRG